MRLIIRRLGNLATGQETGAILTAMATFKINRDEKEKLCGLLKNYAHHTLYPGEGLNVFDSIHTDTPSVVAIMYINNINEQRVELDEL